ncbi:MAG: hypothetical protein ACHQO8_08450 [Vicinamibacterales bacterium]
MKNTVIFALSGALLGIVAASFVVPPALSWYTEPGGLPHGADVQALVQVPAVIKYATSKLIDGQFVGAIVGAIVGLVCGILFARRGRRSTS